MTVNLEKVNSRPLHLNEPFTKEKRNTENTIQKDKMDNYLQTQTNRGEILNGINKIQYMKHHYEKHS